jgi:hypothetical protein
MEILLIVDWAQRCCNGHRRAGGRDQAEGGWVGGALKSDAIAFIGAGNTLDRLIKCASHETAGSIANTELQ